MVEPDLSAVTYGQLGFRTAPADLASLLTEHGVNASWNKFCVEVNDCSHFKFEFTNGHAALDADADTLEQMIADARMVSDALTSAGIKHQFSVHDHHEELITHFHHEWPPVEDN